MKLDFDRPLQHLRAGAPRYKCARPNLCVRAFELRDMPYRSLFVRTFSLFPKYNNRQKRIAAAQEAIKA